MNTRRVKRIDELARDVPPARDLWPAISTAIEAEKAAAAAPSAERRRNWWPAPAVAAAIALVAVGVLIGRQMTPDVVVTMAATGTVPASDAAAMPAAFQRDAKYQKVREELLSEVETRLEAMPPDEREKVAASLATLRRSIAEIEAALGRDPANALLQELLVTSRQEEMRALTVVRDSGRQEI